MSDNNNALIIGAAVLGYLYLKNNQGRVIAGQTRPVRGGVTSMPGNVGSGWQQVGVGAVTGFLQSVIGGVRNNTSQTNFPSSRDPLDAIRGDQVQEGTYDDTLIGDGSEFNAWA
ncbi:hypothetical protein [Duganella violaceipulchra]|uniref:Uncharacterized protein n=1 Tax=Duganella violaceipulchra TaxID=2849652 RepID=A0AA41HBJ6_9BURK|nr:hypothetical protein [Duganella violaceicalia]MBV6324360.1 hypothetical protein [Duganella violaceicalia]MCP2007247.1 hypothetical protein [Duganella violaceicalia]